MLASYQQQSSAAISNCARPLEGGETLHNPHDSFSRSTSSDILCCPQPWRPTSPTHNFRNTRKSKRMVTTEEREKEAGEEIQQILFNKAKSRSVTQMATIEPVPNQYPKSSSTGPILRLVPHVQHHRNPSETYSSCSDDEGNRGNDGEIHHSCGGNPDATADRTSENASENQRESISHLRFVVAPSISPGMSHQAASGAHVLYEDAHHVVVRESVVTPPLRAPNPITMNSPFSTEKRVRREGAEIGLLSFSPPPNLLNDLDLIERRMRLKLRSFGYEANQYNFPSPHHSFSIGPAIVPNRTTPRDSELFECDVPLDLVDSSAPSTSV
jgi:hypothetical protein